MSSCELTRVHHESTVNPQRVHHESTVNLVNSHESMVDSCELTSSRESTASPLWTHVSPWTWQLQEELIKISCPYELSKQFLKYLTGFFLNLTTVSFDSLAQEEHYGTYLTPL